MNRNWIGLALIAALFGSAVHAAEVPLRVMETTDLHMNLLSYDYYQDKATDQYGLSRAITLIKAARAEVTNSMLFDNGDLLQGNPLGDMVVKVHPLKDGQVHPAFKVMNQLGYDVGNIGNHDFNYGLPFLQRAIKGASFPYISSNVYLDDQDKNSAQARHAFTPYLLLDRQLKDTEGKGHNFKIGVIGFVPPQIMTWDKANLEGRVVARDMVEVAKKYVPEMRAKGAQLIIAIAHSGFEKGDLAPFAENVVSRLAEVAGIDAILFGHAHAEFPSPAFAAYPKVDVQRGTINGVAAVMPGRWGDHLGVVDFKLDNSTGQWKIVDSRSSIRPIFDRVAKKSVAEADPMVEQLIGVEHAQTLAYVRDRVASTSSPIYSYFAQVSDDASVQIVSNAQIAYVKRVLQGTEYEKYPVLSAASPFKAGGRQGSTNYTDIPTGPLAIKHVADLYVYPNTLKAVLLTGAEVKEWIEMSSGQFNRIDPKGAAEQALVNPAFPSFNFDTLDGVTYELDLTQAAKYAVNGSIVVADANRVKNLKFQGQPIQLDAKFVVATNNYRAFGGGNFPGLSASKVILDSPDENRQVLIEYLSGIDKLSGDKKLDLAADGNWRIQAVPGVKLGFMSSGAAVKYLTKHPNIRWVKDNGDGSALYQLVD
jgi:2',3'-cyclic-nucleotide 2'-phosphodiesterase/3'-nucleotidase